MRANGFTLVELLVALAVMGLLASAAVLAMPSGGGEARRSAVRFAGQLAATRDEAIVGSRPAGVWMTASGYGFERFAGGQWQPLESRPFESRDWGKGLSASLGGRPTGRVRFDTVGLPDSPVEVTIQSGDSQAVVSLSPGGEVAVR